MLASVVHSGGRAYRHPPRERARAADSLERVRIGIRVYPFLFPLLVQSTTT